MNIFLSGNFRNATSKIMHTLACVKFTSFTYTESFGDLATPTDDVIGIVVDQVRPNEMGRIAILGIFSRIDTKAYPVGTLLYCGANGYLTDQPSGSNHLAIVLKQSNDGAIYINCISSNTQNITTGGGGDVTAPGTQNPNELAYWTADNELAGYTNIKINQAIQGFDMGLGQSSGWLGPVVLLNNQPTPQPVLSYPMANNEDMILKYSVVRDGERSVGEIVITATPSKATIMHRFGETSPLGIEFSVALVGPNVVLSYTTPNSGFNSSFRYRFDRWGGN